MAQKTRADLQTQINSLLADNTAGDISATDVRTVDGDNIDSNLNLLTTDITEVEAGYLKGVTSLIQTQIDGKASLTGATFTGDVTAPDFIGDLNGAVRFAAKNESGATLLKGKVVAIIGVSGSETNVDLADADNASARPAFGLVYADANNNAAVEVVTLGELAGLNTSAFSVGDTLYVSTTAGDLTTTPPTSEAADIQNIGRVIRSHASAGIIRVGGAGRANQTPNLDSAKIFLGNETNQSVATAVTGEVTISNTGETEVTGIDGNISIQGFRPIISTTSATINLANGTHEGTFIYSNLGTAVTVNIRDNATEAFPVGTEIDIIQAGAGVVTLTPASGVELNGDTANIAITAQWGGVTLKQITVNGWIAVGKI